MSIPAASLLFWMGAWLGSAGPATADVVVFESYGGARPDDAPTLLAPLYTELAAIGHTSDTAEVTERIESLVSRSATSLSSSAFVEAVELIERGYERWLAGEFEAAVEDLSTGHARFRAHPATLVIRSQYRESFFKSLVGLSLAHSRLGHAEHATRAMAELLRSFPDMEISRDEYGPEPRELYRKVRADLEQRGTATLRVATDDDTVLVFVNEHYVGVGERALEDLYPGRYRILLRRGSTLGRVHEIDVAPGTEQTLSINWGLESSLRTEAGYVGFEFTDDDARQQHESEYATSVGSRIGASGIVVVGIREYRDRRSIVGTVLDLDTSKPLRTGAVAVEPVAPSPDEVRALARFLASGRPAPGIMIDGETVADAPPQERSTSPWAWITLGGGLVALASGVTLIAIHDPEIQNGERQESYRNSRTPGIILAAGGAVLTGVGIYLWRRDRGRAPRTETALVPMVGESWGLAVAGEF